MFVEKTTNCPNCGATVTYHKRKNAKRFWAKIKRCGKCSEVFR